ncbi:mannose-6-phosphate isomerase, class I [Rhodococcus ruber]|uniref:mannose-6-phosphate isomerase, class I n=1 Tax=Rhodococcus TaxID=1827 RepID=UPI000C7E1BBA|nr:MULTISPECIES: mannose-6-phosphate isomerase, class I [Rhodococcus]AUM18136.1 mannose-6-phosphate isomerase, class I [Rhodococcus ruber]MBD8055880.1 mannose-6-phosphate isomerase, class I [Rhodococcus ruber]
MYPLRGAVRHYSWGSHTALAVLTGRPAPTEEPEAELWLGAHPVAPATVDAGDATVPLCDLIARDPEGQLGPDCARQFDGRMPFLLKVLAAEQPLSLQAHPSRAQAREGFARENAAGIPLDAPHRNYRDDNHKPEMVVALSRFEALAGFRPPAETVEFLRDLGVSEVTPYASELGDNLDATGLRALFTAWMTLPTKSLVGLTDAVLSGCERYLEARSGSEDEFTVAARTALELGLAYPEDPGVLASLLLNRVSMEPGDALFLPAGNLHAYLRGTAVEIMANSDNVLRGGLTSKHVDVPELLRVLDFDSVDVPWVRARRDGHERLYAPPVHEFELWRVRLHNSGTPEPATAAFAGATPRILLCVQGSVQLRCGYRELNLAQGEAAWAPSSDPELVVRSSHATVFVATPPIRSESA